MKLKLKQSRGITLISLVVTIVVLIILAGISLNLLLREDGLIAKAREAKTTTEIATARKTRISKRTSTIRKV